LHLGSLTCALASFLDAKAHNGKWLVRIEDIDPPREQRGADKLILESLKAHGLHWDGDLRYQSARTQAYEQALETLSARGLSYYCSCNRARLKALDHQYDGHCRGISKPPEIPAAIRLNIAKTKHVITQFSGFEDQIHGQIPSEFGLQGDFIIHRKDKLFAYNLAVVIDDIDQGITHIVRGNDLIDTTNQQRLLHRLFSDSEIVYTHIPVLAHDDGAKLSKQNLAPALDNNQALDNLTTACRALGMMEYPKCRSTEELLSWAARNWQVSRVKPCKYVTLSELSDGSDS
jgi:glutamyl-Q tRNA(Asp) synthetase